MCAPDNPADCVRWCEPSDPIFKERDDDGNDGGIVRITKQPDGSLRMRINGQVTDPGGDAPRYDAATRLEGCLHGATRQSLALVLDVLHTGTVRAPQEGADEAIEETVGGTIAELAEQFGLTIE